MLDPIWTASLVALNHAYAVYDTLYGIAQDFSPMPQMVAGHTVSDDWAQLGIQVARRADAP